MSFITDKQTLDDLSIFSKRGQQSVFSIFNHTNTKGGAEQLEQMFRAPLSSEDAINRRSGIIRFFGITDQAFPFSSQSIEQIELYLNNTDVRSQLTHEKKSLARIIKQVTGSDTGYQRIANGISSLISVIHQLKALIQEIRLSPQSAPYEEELSAIGSVLATEGWDVIFRHNQQVKPGFEENIKFDRIFRYRNIEEVKQLLCFIYNLDVYSSVARVARKRNFVFPEAISKEAHSLHLTDVYHPLLQSPVSNSISITPDNNVAFLTGANMAGKSTFMKAVGTAVYLAHMGFPVAAAKMQFSVRDGFFSTINLPDSLSLGYSHFYVEVLRVKKVVEQMALSKSLFVIFDELFRGTNVKDAREATIAIISVFARMRNCQFIVSTHIMEAGDVLQKAHENIHFIFLPTHMQLQGPVYTYRLEKGITPDRHGMIIIKNEGIMEVLQKGLPKQ
ncbi:MAG: MutS-related protein [Pseudobacter sp.]|uniref:MutS-related protein n=1 Tax=Pseudobacter sp. TaxID=2045420 RepID=UPI003F7DD2E1